MSNIPNRVIACVTSIFSQHYSQAELNNLFRLADVSVDDYSGSRSDKIHCGLDRINEQSSSPLTALGKLLQSYMDSMPATHYDAFETAENKREREERFNSPRIAIQDSLRAEGFIYQHGGMITPLTAQPILTLTERIKSEGMTAAQQEIEQAMAALRAGNFTLAIHKSATLLEAVYKAYLDKYRLSYQENATANDLWNAVAEHLNLRPGNQLNSQFRDIASSFYKIAKAVAELRNQHGGHGPNQAQYAHSQAITAAQAELAVNAAAALSSYILEA